MGISPILQALFAHLMSGGGASGSGTPGQNVAGILGHLGGPQGVSQGPVGASVPQTGQGGPGIQAGVMPLGPQAVAGPSAQGGSPAGVGMAQVLPALAALAPLLPHILKFLASLAGEAGKSSSGASK
jgi:hypothetical protein